MVLLEFEGGRFSCFSLFGQSSPARFFFLLLLVLVLN